MAYHVRYRSRAKAELNDACEVYGATFNAQVHEWLEYLASEAEKRQYFSSVDIQELIALIADNPKVAKKLTSSWQRWLQAPFPEKLLALLVLVRNRCPPWEFRGSFQTFTVIDTFTSEVHALYEVDHVNHQIIIALFTGLPGQ
jgi:hypothetical protein